MSMPEDVDIEAILAQEEKRIAEINAQWRPQPQEEKGYIEQAQRSADAAEAAIEEAEEELAPQVEESYGYKKHIKPGLEKRERERQRVIEQGYAVAADADRDEVRVLFTEEEAEKFPLERRGEFTFRIYRGVVGPESRPVYHARNYIENTLDELAKFEEDEGHALILEMRKLRRQISNNKSRRRSYAIKHYLHVLDETPMWQELALQDLQEHMAELEAKHAAKLLQSNKDVKPKNLRCFCQTKGCGKELTWLGYDIEGGHRWAACECGRRVGAHSYSEEELLASEEAAANVLMPDLPAYEMRALDAKITECIEDLERKFENYQGPYNPLKLMRSELIEKVEALTKKANNLQADINRKSRRYHRRNKSGTKVMPARSPQDLLAMMLKLQRQRYEIGRLQNRIDEIR